MLAVHGLYPLVRHSNNYVGRLNSVQGGATLTVPKRGAKLCNELHSTRQPVLLKIEIEIAVSPQPDAPIGKARYLVSEAHDAPTTQPIRQWCHHSRCGGSSVTISTIFHGVQNCRQWRQPPVLPWMLQSQTLLSNSCLYPTTMIRHLRWLLRVALMLRK